MCKSRIKIKQPILNFSRQLALIWRFSSIQIKDILYKQHKKNDFKYHGIWRKGKYSNSNMGRTSLRIYYLVLVYNTILVFVQIFCYIGWKRIVCVLQPTWQVKHAKQKENKKVKCCFMLRKETGVTSARHEEMMFCILQRTNDQADERTNAWTNARTKERTADRPTEQRNEQNNWISVCLRAFSIKCQRLLCDWFKKLAPTTQPIRCKTKN